jgi:hypothetical protein
MRIMPAANDPTPATPPLPDAGIQASSPTSTEGRQAGADTAIQQPPAPAAPGAIPLPPPTPRPRPLTAAEQALLHGQLDAALVGGVLLLSFLLASVAVRNTDFYQHLAAGRALVDGNYNPLTGQDPFSYTGSGYWVNHSWLFDLLLYGVTWLAGIADPEITNRAAAAGPVLVLLKALLVAATAGVLLLIRRPGQSLWLPAAATLLAVLAASPRLVHLQPRVVSLLFLAVTLWLLQRPSSKSVPLSWLPRGWPGSGPTAPSHLWWLPPLFFLWVNLDNWFLLGPLTVGLFLLGDLLEALPASGTKDRQAPDKAAAAGGERRTLAAVLGVGLLACLLNPFHVHAFLALPAEIALTGPVTAVRQVQRYDGFFLSPFTTSYAEGFGLSVAGLAFYALLVLGIGSFVANPGAGKSWRGLVFAVFALLACWRWDLISFFAVVAGPILVLNFQDWAARRQQAADKAGSGPAVGQPADRLALGQLGSFLTGRWLASLSAGALGALVVLFAGLIALVVWLRSEEETGAYVLTLLGVPKPPVTALLFLFLLLGLGVAFLVVVLRYRYQAFASWPLGGRLLSLLGVLVLLVLVWPGWLQEGAGDPSRARRVTWSVEPDESLVKAARQLLRWRQENLLAGNGLNWTHEVANYCAWFCYTPQHGPEEKDYFDLRFQLFPAFGRYVEARKALNQEDLEPAEGEEPPTLQSVQAKLRQHLKEVEDDFRARGISHVVVYEPLRAGKSSAVVGHLLGDTPLNPGAPGWTLLYQDGRTTIFGWDDPQDAAGAGRFAPLKYDARRLAFGPRPQGESVREGEAAGPRAPLIRSWLGDYLVGPPPHPLEADEATAHLAAFEGSRGRYAEFNQKVWRSSYATATVGAASWSVPGGGPAAAGATAALAAFRGRLAELAFPSGQAQPPNRPPPGKIPNKQDRMDAALRNGLMNSQLQFFQGLDQGEPARAVLAVQAARRAVRRNPEDAGTYLTLYRAYLNQAELTRERAWRASLPPLQYLRQVQMINALQTAINLQEDSRAASFAHVFLAQIYLDPSVGYLDLALRHRKEQLRLARLHGAVRDEKAEDFDNRIKQLEDAAERLEEEVDKRKLQFGVGSGQGELVLRRARRALEQGLAEEALQTLLQSNAVEFRSEGAQLQINLLLTMGRAEEARRMISDKEVAKNFAEGHLGNVQLGEAVLPAYPWFLLVLAEVGGDDAEAEKQLEELCRAMRPPPPDALPRALGHAVLDSPPRPDKAVGMLARVLHPKLPEFPPEIEILRYMAVTRQHADLFVLRGILALDRGDTKAARKAFEEVLPFAGSPDQPVPAFESFARPARHYLGLLDAVK